MKEDGFASLPLVTAGVTKANHHHWIKRVSSTTIFSKVDLIHRYHQILEHSRYIHRTIITTHFDLWEFLQIPV